MDEIAIGKEVVDAPVRLHRDLGPGLLETVYEVVLARELETRFGGAQAPAAAARLCVSAHGCYLRTN